MAIQQQLQIILNAQNNTANAFNSLNKSLNDLKDTAIKIGAALAGALAIKDIVATTEQWGMAVRGIQAETGLAAEQASRLVFAAQAVGVSSDELNTALGRLDKQLFSTATIADLGKSAFDKWNISVEDASGKTKNVAEVLSLTADRVKQLGDGAAARALEMDIFGRSGGRLHDLLMLGADGVKQLTDESDALGLTLNQQGLTAVREFTVQTRVLGLAAEGLKVQLGILLLPILNFVVSALTRLAQWINTNVIHSREFAGVLKVVGEVLQRIAGLFKAVADATVRFVDSIASKGLLGALKDLAGDIGRAVVQLFSDIGTKLDSLGPLGTVAKDVIIALGAALLVLGGAAVIGGIVNLGRALTVALIANPVGLLIAAIALAVVALWEIAQTIGVVIDNWDKAVVAFKTGALDSIPIIGGILHVVRDIGGAFDALAYAIKTLFANAEDVVRSSIQNLIVLVDQLILKINEISGSHIPTIPGVGGGGGGDGGAPGGGPGVGSGPSVAHGEKALAIACEARPWDGPDGTTGYYQWNWSDHTCFPVYGASPRGGGRALAAGGIVLPRPGGTRVTVGEAGQAEAIIPLGRGGGFGATYNITINASGNIGMDERELAAAIGDQMLSKLSSFRGFTF